MEIISERITRQELFEKYATAYQIVTKAVVDLERRMIAVDAEWHSDLEALLLEDGSAQQDLWGVNLRLTKPPEEFIVYESLINIRPAQQSFSTVITDPFLQQRIKRVIDALVDYGDPLVLREPGAEYGVEDYVRSAAFAYAFKHHKQLGMEKWRSFEPYKRVIMIANEFGRAQDEREADSQSLQFCYERALELIQITIDAARIEGRPKELIYGLLHLRERTARLYAGKILDPEENARLKEECFRLEPEAWALTHPQGTALP